MSAPTAVVLIPVKPLAVAKSRLRAALGGTTDALVLAMALDTIAAAAGSGLVRSVVVITDDAAVRAAAASIGASVVPDRAAAGLNAALRSAAARVPGTCVTVAQPADCPCVQPAHFDALVEMCAHLSRRVFVPDAQGTGTTALAAPAGVPLRPLYGTDSRSHHLSDGAGELLGVRWTSMSRDVDTSDDLRQAAAQGVGARTSLWLQRNR